MSILLIILLVTLEVRGRSSNFYEPLIYITKPEQEVKVDGCATPKMTLGFPTPINVCHLSLYQLTLLRARPFHGAVIEVLRRYLAIIPDVCQVSI